MLARGLVGLLSISMMVACSSLGGGDGDNGDDGNPDIPDAGPIPDAPPGAFVFEGSIDNQFLLPGYGAVLWTVTIGSASLHSYGGGGSEDGENFRMHSPGFLPPEALNGGSTGVAFFGLLPPGQTIPEGEIFTTGYRNDFIGVAGEYAIVFRSAPFVFQFPWEDQFPVGFSCAGCMRAGLGVDNDILFPIPCEDVVIKGGDFEENPICNIF